MALPDEASQKLAENQPRPDGLKKTAQETIALGNEILRGLSVLEEALVEVCCCVCVCVCLSACVRVRDIVSSYTQRIASRQRNE